MPARGLWRGIRQAPLPPPRRRSDHCSRAPRRTPRSR